MVNSKIQPQLVIISNERMAFIAFLMGAISMFMGCVQPLGDFYFFAARLPLDLISPSATFIGLISGIFGLKSKRKTLAELGLILCIVGLFCNIVLVPS